MNTFTPNFGLSGTRRSKERRKSSNNSRNQRPKLFRRQQRFELFQRKKIKELN
jgi:hypothetical protein